MNRTIQTNTQNFNGPESSNTTTIRRTLVEHGVRPVNDDTQTQNGPSTNLSAITALAKQHQDEQRELQQLNAKLSSYLGHVHDLETFNGQLLAELDDLKQKWGYDTDKLHATYDSQLKTLRDGINNSLRDQILPELQLKQYEYDIWQTQQRINALGGDPRYRFNELEQELNNGIKDLERLKNQFDRRSTEIVQQRTNLENLGNEFDGLQNELLNQRLERLMLQNELQTLREDLAFQDAIYQAQRQEILSLSKILY
jgi:chromosome segregation ATPase